MHECIMKYMQGLSDYIKMKQEKVFTVADADKSNQNKFKLLLSVKDSWLASN